MVRRWGLIAGLAVAVAAIGTPVPGLGATVAAAAGQSVDVPSAIDSSGGRDVSDELNAFFAGLADGTTVRFPSSGRYRVESVVYLDRRHDVILEGNGSTLVATTDGSGIPKGSRPRGNRWPRSRAHLVIRASTGITVRDLTVEGPNLSGDYRPELEAQAAFVVVRSKVVTLDGVTARATYGDGVYIQGKSEDVTLRGCTLDHNGRQGVAAVSGERIVVEGCTIEGTGRSVIDLEPARGTVRDVHVRNNRVGDYTNFLLAAVGAGAGVQDVWLENNRVSGGRGVSLFVGVKGSVRTGIHVLDNVGDGISDGYEGALMRFSRMDGIEVKGNRQRVAKGVIPVLLVNSCNSTVTGNTFEGADETVQETGDCLAAVPVPRRGTRVPVTPPASGKGRTSRIPPTTAAPIAVPTVPVARGSGTSAVAIAVALTIGALAGVGGTLALVSWRKTRGDDGETSAPDAGA